MTDAALPLGTATAQPARPNLDEGTHLGTALAFALLVGVAGAMAASGSGLHWSTLPSIIMAWVPTLPAAMLISGVLFALLCVVF